jgi:hypothetical protein
MNLSDLIEAIDKYCVDYIRFILSVTNKSVFIRRSGQFDQNLITFSIISVTLGDYLYTSYVSHKIFVEANLLPQLVEEFSIWLALTLLAYVGIALGRKSLTRFTDVLTSVLQVMPAAFVLSCYVGIVTNSLAVLFFDQNCAPWWALLATLASRSAILLAYLPFALVRVGNLVGGELGIAQFPSRFRARSVASGLIVAMFAIDLVALGSDIVANAKLEVAPVAAVFKLPRNDPKRVSVAAATSDPILSACLSQGMKCNMGALPHALFQEHLRGIASCLTL